MSAKKSKTDIRIKNIIEYNTTRKYFGDWTPYELNETYPGTELVHLHIGILSVDKICDALWNEMSYNPKRFGVKSPFKFNGKNSLYLFINKEIDQENNALEALSDIKTNLIKFWIHAIKYDTNFPITNQFKNTFVTIQHTPQQNANSKPIPDKTYKMLGFLRNCIHIIASQNITDFERKSYREQIINAVTSKHPNLIRPQKLTTKNTDYLQYLRNRTYLEHEIFKKTSEISITQSRIDSLNNEFEIPADTSAEESRLQSQIATLNELESRLKTLYQKHRIYGN